MNLNPHKMIKHSTISLTTLYVYKWNHKIQSPEPVKKLSFLLKLAPRKFNDSTVACIIHSECH